MESIRALNPQYKNDIVPGESMDCTLRLPFETIAMFIEYGDSIYNHKAKDLLSKRKFIDMPAYRKGAKNVTYHTIKSGETLGSIAIKYHVKVSQIMKWNNMRNTNIRAGKYLKIYK